MAKVFGESGRYVADEAVNSRRRLWVRALTSCCVLSALGGFTICLQMFSRSISPEVSLGLTAVLVLAIVSIGNWATRKLDVFEKHRMDMRRGAEGENLVAARLREFPENFWVINDLTTPFGNLDHVVVGPTGVFILDTKNWRGIVTPDGNGELLLNGKALDKPYVGQFVSRVMHIREPFKALAKGLDPYFQPVFVFTAARVDAPFKTTGQVHCVRDERLWDYIVEWKLKRKWTTGEAEKIAQAFLALAHMEARFTAKAGAPTSNGSSVPARQRSGDGSGGASRFAVAQGQRGA
jgi:hypothetical protein